MLYSSGYYLLYSKCQISAAQEVLNLQHPTAIEYSATPFSANCIPMVSYFTAVLIICYIASVVYMLHMQCCKVAKMQPLIAVE